jgi:peptidylprolyl isomerase
LSSTAIKPKDFILLDYVARIKDTKEIVDVTQEEVAKKEKAYKPDGVYEPMLVAVGEGWVVKGLDEALVGLREGAEKEIELSPEKAFGTRDPQKLKILSARDLSRRGITPRIGQRVEIDGQLALIRTVGSGRITADFNHPLAGKVIVYTVKVARRLRDTEEKIRELIHRRLKRIPKENFKITISKNGVDIDVPTEAATLEDFGFAIMGISRDVNKYLDHAEKIRFFESFEYKEEKPAVKAKAPKKSEKAPKKAKLKSSTTKKAKVPAESAPA